MEQMQPDILCSLDQAETLNRQGFHEEAALICRRILQLDSGNLEATFMLATIMYATGSWDEAAILYRQACNLALEIGFLRINLALALQELGCFEEALAAFDEAEALGETTVNLYYNRGVLLQRLERMEPARHAFEQALAIDPQHLNSWINLTAVCLASDDNDGALHSCRHGLHLDSDNVALIGNLAIVYGKMFRFEESLACYQRVLELVRPDERAELLGSTANCLSELWMVDDAIACFDLAIASSNHLFQKRALASTRLFMLHYSANWSAAAIAAEHKNWGQQYFEPVAMKHFANDPDPDRPIRVAYLSPDLKIHAVVFFLQPVLAAHDPAQVTVYCYSDVKKPDVVTRQLKEQHHVIWRDCSAMDDASVQELLLQDQIDVLVDLAGHTALNRLPLFAGRAAPLQVSWIGYPNSTGLMEMDYRISDAWADPPGVTDPFHTEELIRLPDSFLCYRPGADFPAVGSLPCQTNGYVTFGSFSNFKKVTPDILDLWARILAKVPDSHLVFRARGLSHDRFVRDIAPLFLRHQVAPERISVLGHARSVVENLEGYHTIDIALDTFPYHGTTTTCEALCMGVPVVTRAGDSHVSRVGVSLLHSVGLPELIGNSPEEYCSLAVALAADTVRLAALRSSLRDRLLASPLADNSTFTCHLEGVYRQIWQRWCKENSR
ncbi:Tetratricopeptide TPR_2 repeat protein [Trichlorobacter lovleyi SZ]|uniref:protein O-GlcNAc transferase n=2 Tax=Trichlorobacter lovleyi TaxID=313985 RepID=B3EBN6_TRIL1|nr:Tetratricopeptide TPR_2 repeat protein [Trichlorobacter lovleyi SZ]